MDPPYPWPLVGEIRGDPLTENPEVTVLMSVYNGEMFLKEAIDSILSQTFRNFEFLIINDASSDGSRNIIASFPDRRIRLIDNPSNIGLTKSLNKGLDLARGKFIARQDADDISHPERLKCQVNFLEKNPSVVLLGTRVRFMHENGRCFKLPGREKPVTWQGIQWYLMFGDAFAHPSVMYRREIIRGKLNGYNEDFSTGQDSELWPRVASKYEVRNLPDELVCFRVHGNSVSAGYGVKHRRNAESLARMNLQRYLCLTDVPAAWPRIIAGIYNTGNPDREIVTWGIVESLNAIYRRFAEIIPAVDTNQEIHRNFVSRLVDAAFHLVKFNRWQSLSAYLRAAKMDFRTAGTSLGRFLAMFFLGEFLFQRIRDLVRITRKYRSASIRDSAQGA